MDTRQKILSPEALEIRLEQERRQHRRIVLASGCFDLLEARHVRYLQSARREGDTLVVGVHADAVVRARRGPGRPVVPARARAELVAALAAVDYVVACDMRGLEALLATSRPDIYAVDAAEMDAGGQAAARLGACVVVIGEPGSPAARDLATRLRESFHG